MIIGILSFFVKVQNVLDLKHLRDAIVNLHTEAKTAYGNTTRAAVFEKTWVTYRE